MYILKTRHWFWLMLPLVRASLDSASSADAFDDLSHTNTDANSGFARRQISPSTTFDFWWPFPAPAMSTTTSPTTPVGTPIPFLISPAASATRSADVMPSSSITVPISAITSETSLTSTRPPPSSSQASSSDDTVPTAQSAEASALGAFKFTTLIPAFVSVAVFLSALGIWLLYGCYTRKPRNRYDDSELVCGPPYANIQNHDGHGDVEQHGSGDEMFEVPQNYARRGRPGQLQYRWPSFNEPPPFDPIKGYYNVLDESKHDSDEDPLSTITLLAAPHSNTRDRSQRSSKSALSGANANTNPHPEMSPVFSDATSAALHELYESDDDDDAKTRRAKETPWESLRHKSIRRGIIEQVRKENKWMDSIRGSLAAAAAQISGSAGGDSQNERGHNGQRDNEGIGLLRREDEPTVAARSPRSPEEEAGSSVRRRGHRRSDSNLQVDDVLPSPTYHRPPMNASESIDVFAGSPNGPTGVRRRSRSRSRTRSTSPVKRKVIGRHQDMSGRDILPENPAQILSPPLESQICFTPMALPVPPPIAQPAQSRPSHASPNATTQGVRPKARVRGTTIDTAVSPTRIPMPSPTRTRGTSQPRYRQQASSASSIVSGSSSRPLPIPMSNEDSGEAAGEAARGRPVKKASASINTPSKKRNTTNGSLDALKAEVDQDLRAQMRLQTKNAAEANAMKKVEQIMESSWSARDMQEEEIRCLSPSGFGREP